MGLPEMTKNGLAGNAKYRLAGNENVPWDTLNKKACSDRCIRGCTYIYIGICISNHILKFFSCRKCQNGLAGNGQKKMDLPEMPNMGLPEMKTCLGIRRTQKHAPTNAYAIASASVSSSAKETRLRLRRTTGKEPKRTKKTRKRKRMGKEQSHPTLSWWLVRFPLFCIHQRLHSPTPTFSSQPL